MASVDALIEALKEFEGTICCISHDLYFLNAVADHVVHVDQGKITLYPGNYEYFKRRQAQWHEENPQAVDVPVVEKKAKDKPAAPVAMTPKKKAKLEDEVLTLHLKLEELAAQLGDPAIYADFAKVQAIGEEMETVQAAIQEKEAELAA